ncbi:MAG TPA: TonB-dependent receptor plug domain-containing protein, partial [Woeseiaceae bacterium]|nr:TonB-dependent receptor plug domain-containing protein [Woeseiaceae bacterium]
MADNREPGAAMYGRSAIAAAVSAALTGPSAFAQSQGDTIEEIVVTATKREESLADIPMSIRAFTTDDIVRQGLDGLDDYVGKIPALALASRQPGGNSVVFRGVAASGIQFGTNPSSGIYLDEQPITSAGRNPDPRLIDIERLEALSGPQGTLFGDASQSGTLRVITNKPDPTAFDAWVELEANQVSGGDAG